MHILLTNDDGPPDIHSSPYISAFHRILTSPPFNHTVSVVLPSTQRSWIGKAHLLPANAHALYNKDKKAKPSANEIISDTITPSYYNPTTQEQTTAPLTDSKDYWVLIPGTPATCTQLGLFHHTRLFPSHYPPSTAPAPQDVLAPIDLVLSGPNLGRNTSAAFALSSGTLGGALEGAVCGVRAIAVSFAFFTRQEPQSLVEEASAHAIRIVEALCARWDARPAQGEYDRSVPDVYSINVPLVEDVSSKKIMWTWMLDNKWKGGSLYRALSPDELKPSVEQSTSGVEAQVQQERVEQASEAETKAKACFKWSPAFKDIWKIVEASPQGNDGLAMRQGVTSVTPIRANFEGLYGREGFEGEFKL